VKFVSNTLSFSSVGDDGATHTVRLPFYHRAAVGIFPGTTLFAVPLPSTNEVVLTPIDPKKWGDLWRLEATVIDEPGAAKSLVETLVANKVNVLVHEGVSEAVRQGKTAHEVFEILDLADYTDEIDGTSETRNSGGKSMLKPNHLVNQMVGRSANYLAQAHELNGWELRFERMEFFFRNKEARFNSVDLSLNVDNEVHVPGSVLKELALVRDLKCPLPLHIISDTEQKYVKLRVLSPEKYYVLFEIEHVEQVGAIDELMAVFKNREANMIDSYSRLKSIAQSALFYALAEFDRRMTKRKVEGILKELAASSLARSVVLKGAFGAGPELETLTLPDTVSIRQLANDKPAPSRHGSERVTVKKDGEQDGVERRQDLGVPYYVDGRGSSSWTLNTAQVFMAVPFSKRYVEFYDDYIAAPVIDSGLEPIRVDRLLATAKRRSIIDRIEEGIARSRFMIADLTNLNPNVIYEIGLAVGISKPVLILCEDKHFDAKEIPFDFQSYELIEYSPYRANGLKLQLAEKIAQLKMDTAGS
jgi:hypothetical protein